MPKPSKKAATSATSLSPQVGDMVYLANSEMLYEISSVSPDGAEVNLHVPGTNLERFRVRTDSLVLAKRKVPAKTSNPFTSPEPVFDAKEVLERIATVQRENLERSDDDIDILKAYLKTQQVPRAVIEVLEGVTIDQHQSWKKAVERIKKLLEE
jgi:hypothetical protein